MSCKYYVIFCPKYRRKLLVNAVASRLKELLAQIAIKIKVEILEMQIMPDYVHLLIDVDPQFGLHLTVKRFKGAISRYLQLEFSELKSRLPSLWTNFYFHLVLEALL